MFVAPHHITNLRVEHTRISNDSFNLNVTWDLPEVQPDSYFIRFDGYGLHGDESTHSLNVSGVSKTILAYKQT